MIDWTNALWVGIVGGIVMLLMMTLARSMGLIDANMTKYQGCMITKKDEGAGTMISGLIMHLMFSALIALLYAWGFAAIWGQSTWVLGLLLGAIHWVIAGVVLPMMDGMNACVKGGRIGAFGAFGKNYGAMMVVGFLMGHLLYGAIVGWLYTVPLGA
jgi:hypothetical protein